MTTGSVTSRPSKTQRRPAVATASSAMERSSTAPRGRDANSHPLHALGQDLVQDAHLARLAERVLVLAEVLLRERVDVRVSALLRRLDDPPADLHVAVGVVGVLDGERHARVARQVPHLDAALRRVEAHVRAVEVDPHGRHLRRAVGARRGEVRERLLRKEIAVLLGDRSHAPMEPDPASRVHPLDARPAAGPQGAQGGPPMLYIAFVKNKPRWQLGDVDLTAKSREWWNEGKKPAGLRTVGFWGSLSSEAPDVIVFEAESHEDIRKMIAYWKEADFEVHPALDLGEVFRRQGMKIA